MAFVGRCLKGPVHRPHRVTSFAEFQQLFGGLWSESGLPFALQQFFEQGGREARVVRVINGGAAPTLHLPAGNDRLELVGVCPGASEFLRVSVDYDGIRAEDSDLFNLVVQRVRHLGSERVEAQEIYRRLSILSGSAREVARMLASSVLVRVQGALPAVRPDVTSGTGGERSVGYVESNRDGDDGAPLDDYDLIGSADRATGLFSLGGVAFNFLYLPTMGSRQDVGNSALLVAARYCRQRHALLLVDPPQSWNSLPEALEGMEAWPLRSADAVMFYPPLKAMDRLSGRERRFPPSAAAVGWLVRDETTVQQLWQEGPAGQLRPSIQSSTDIDEIARLRLERRGINALYAFRGGAASRPGWRTLADHSAATLADRQLSQRRMTLMIAASIEAGTRWVASEGNNERSRERVGRQVERFLAHLAQAGALAGSDRRQHYFVICDERVNDPARVAAGEFQLIYGFQLLKTSRAQCWQVIHRRDGSSSQPVQFNYLAMTEWPVKGVSV